MKGVPARAVRLLDNDDDTYTLTVDGTVGETRAEGRIPAADFLVAGLNEIVGEIDQLGDAVPDGVHAAIARFMDRWDAFNGQGTHTPAGAYPEPGE